MITKSIKVICAECNFGFDQLLNERNPMHSAKHYAKYHTKKTGHQCSVEIVKQIIFSDLSSKNENSLFGEAEID